MDNQGQDTNYTISWVNNFLDKGYKDKMYDAHKKLFDVDKEVDETLFQQSVWTIENKLNQLIKEESTKSSHSNLIHELLAYKDMLEAMPQKVEYLKQKYIHSQKDQESIHSFALNHHGQTVQVFEQISTAILDCLPSHEHQEIFDALAHIESYEAHHWNQNINFQKSIEA